MNQTLWINKVSPLGRKMFEMAEITTKMDRLLIKNC